MSKASDISNEISVRIEAIKKVRGYLTDIGAKVMRGRRKLDEGHIPCSIIVEGDDSVEDRRQDAVKIAQTYQIEGHSECDPDNPNDTAHDMIADLKRAVFGGAALLGGRCRELRYNGRIISPREDGLSIVSAAIEIEVVFVENPASP